MYNCRVVVSGYPGRCLRVATWVLRARKQRVLDSRELSENVGVSDIDVAGRNCQVAGRNM